MRACTLRSWTCGNVGLADAVAACAALLTDSAVGLVYSLESASFVSVKNNALVDHFDKPATLDRVFEARVFSRAGELRWLKDPAAVGNAAFVSEEEAVPTGFVEISATRVEAVDDRQYLLWGQGLAQKTKTLATNWAELTSPRIGHFPVPHSVLPGRRLILRTIEYVGLEAGPAGEKHGNVAVVEERLIELGDYPVAPASNR